mmetsp:Transcript_101114/g.286600  ORF Transcript_101114/g.286600 Transcript_101114/m.286600 type:complete len:406 (-) Transcript_101114:94-1311(-)
MMCPQGVGSYRSPGSAQALREKRAPVTLFGIAPRFQASMPVDVCGIPPIPGTPTHVTLVLAPRELHLRAPADAGVCLGGEVLVDRVAQLLAVRYGEAVVSQVQAAQRRARVGAQEPEEREAAAEGEAIVVKHERSQRSLRHFRKLLGEQLASLGPELVAADLEGVQHRSPSQSAADLHHGWRAHLVVDEVQALNLGALVAQHIKEGRQRGRRQAAVAEVEDTEALDAAAKPFGQRPRARGVAGKHQRLQCGACMAQLANLAEAVRTQARAVEVEAPEVRVPLEGPGEEGGALVADGVLRQVQGREALPPPQHLRQEALQAEARDLLPEGDPGLGGGRVARVVAAVALGLRRVGGQGAPQGVPGEVADEGGVPRRPEGLAVRGGRGVLAGLGGKHAAPIALESCER